MMAASQGPGLDQSDGRVISLTVVFGPTILLAPCAPYISGVLCDVVLQEDRYAMYSTEYLKGRP
jgi:hypothetical protein